MICGYCSHWARDGQPAADPHHRLCPCGEAGRLRSILRRLVAGVGRWSSAVGYLPAWMEADFREAASAAGEKGGGG